MHCSPSRRHGARAAIKAWRGRGAAVLSGAAALLGAAAVPALAAAQQSATPAALVFDRVTVVDVERGKLLPDQRVVITGHRIQAVGRRSAVALPPGAQVVEARGQYLMPGLWDLHVHTAGREAKRYPRYLAMGVTGIRVPGMGPVLDSMVKWRQEILAGRRVGPPRQI